MAGVTPEDLQQVQRRFGHLLDEFRQQFINYKRVAKQERTLLRSDLDALDPAAVIRVIAAVVELREEVAALKKAYQASAVAVKTVDINDEVERIIAEATEGSEVGPGETEV